MYQPGAHEAVHILQRILVCGAVPERCETGVVACKNPIHEVRVVAQALDEVLAAEIKEIDCSFISSAQGSNRISNLIELGRDVGRVLGSHKSRGSVPGFG